MKRILVNTILVVILIASMTLVGCASSTPTPTTGPQATETPSVKEDLEISVYNVQYGTTPQGTPTQNKMWELLGNAINRNLIVKYEDFPGGEWNDKQTIYLATGEFADVFVIRGNKEILDLGSSKKVVNLNDYSTLTPNYNRVLDKGYNRLRVESSDGGVYYFSQMVDSPVAGTQWNWYYNFAAFENNDIAIPSNLDELYLAAKKLKEIYPDSYPMGSSASASWYSPAMVLFNLEKTNQSIYYNGEKYVFGPVHDKDKIKKCLEYLNKFYEEGLLDVEYLTYTWDQLVAKMSTNKTFIVPNFWGAEGRKINVAAASADVQWGYADRPLNFENQIGWKPYSQQLDMPVEPDIGVCINAASKNIELLVKMIDYCYSDEMKELITYGILNETYTKDASGKCTLMPNITGAENPMAEKDKWGFGEAGGCRSGLIKVVNYDVTMQIIGKQKAWSGGKFVDLNYMYVDPSPESVIPVPPPISYTADEAAQKANVMTPIDTYVDEQFTKLIIGDIGFDQWDSIIAKITDMGDYQSILDMMNAKLAAIKK